MKVIGHRGAASLAPENTFAGFDIALQLGVDAIETDVQKTKDGKLVLFHDTHIDRTTNGSGVVYQLTWHELRELDAGSWFHPQYKDEGIPLLIDFLQKYGGKIPIDLEVKQPGVSLGRADVRYTVSVVVRKELGCSVIDAEGSSSPRPDGIGRVANSIGAVRAGGE